MKKEFDFKQVGKRLPYKAPESYIENFKPNSRREAQRKPIKFPSRFFVYAAASVALLIICSIAFLTPDNEIDIQPFEQESGKIANFLTTDFEVIFKDFTDEELTSLSVILDSDLFEN
ncbi:MAG: hypothetical protein Q8S04_11725 [Bacteroidales bacterium]|nr:hypothetical protein [Bacteroidales bacterium]